MSNTEVLCFCSATPQGVGSEAVFGLAWQLNSCSIPFPFLPQVLIEGHSLTNMYTQLHLSALCKTKGVIHINQKLIVVLDNSFIKLWGAKKRSKIDSCNLFGNKSVKQLLCKSVCDTAACFLLQTEGVCFLCFLLETMEIQNL